MIKTKWAFTTLIWAFTATLTHAAEPQIFECKILINQTLESYELHDYTFENATQRCIEKMSHASFEVIEENNKNIVSSCVTVADGVDQFDNNARFSMQKEKLSFFQCVEKANQYATKGFQRSYDQRMYQITVNELSMKWNLSVNEEDQVRIGFEIE